MRVWTLFWFKKWNALTGERAEMTRFLDNFFSLSGLLSLCGLFLLLSWDLAPNCGISLGEDICTKGCELSDDCVYLNTIKTGELACILWVSFRKQKRGSTILISGQWAALLLHTTPSAPLPQNSSYHQALPAATSNTSCMISDYRLLCHIFVVHFLSSCVREMYMHVYYV